MGNFKNGLKQRINYNRLINDRGDAGKRMIKTYKDEVARYLDELRMAKVRSGQINPFDASELKPYNEVNDKMVEQAWCEY